MSELWVCAEIYKCTHCSGDGSSVSRCETLQEEVVKYSFWFCVRVPCVLQNRSFKTSFSSCNYLTVTAEHLKLLRVWLQLVKLLYLLSQSPSCLVLVNAELRWAARAACRYNLIQAVSQ